MSENFGRGESALFLTNPELAAAARRQRLAQGLLEQAVKPRNVGGHAGGLAQMGQALIAGYMNYREDERIRAIAEAQRAREEEEVRALMGGGMPGATGGPKEPVTPPGSLPPPIPLGAEAPPMARALMNPPGQPGQPAQGGAAPAMPLPPPVPTGGPAPSAAPAMAQPGGAGQPMPSMEAIIAGMSSSSPRVRATAQMLFQQAQRREDLALRMQDREEERRFRERELAARRAPAAPAAPPPPFAGNSMEAQANNILLRLAPSIRDGTATPEDQALYQRAWQALSEGQIQFVNDPNDPTGNRQVPVRIPRDMGDLPPPRRQQAPAAPQGMTAPVSQPEVPPSVAAPQVGATVPTQAQDAAPVPGYDRTRPPPPGYQWSLAGRLEPIPGGPADPERQGLAPGQRSLSAPEIALREETDNALKAAQSARSGLERALALSPQAYAGPIAQTRGWVAGFTGFDQRTAAATREFNTIMGQQVLAQLRSIFGGNPTEGERKILLDLEANADMSRVERETLIRRAIEAVQRREVDFGRRLEDIVRGNFGRTEPGFTAPERTPIPGQTPAPARPTSRMRWNPQTNQLEPAQ